MDFKYVIVGGGMTADAAVRGIRERDPNGTIGLISAELDPPYSRPPLSKALWKGKPLANIWRGTEALGAQLFLGRTVQVLDPGGKCVADDSGASYNYEKLLLATGGTPRRLPFGGDHIIYYRTLGDYRRLESLAQKRRRFAVIGGGFIGSEIAAALAMHGRDVLMVIPEEGIGARVFPHGLSAFLTDYYRQKGVALATGRSIVGVEPHGDELALRTRQGSAEEERIVDAVVGGIGIQPNVGLAQAARLQVDNGIVVDEYLRTSRPDIYAAGDVASFFNPALNKRMRVEHEDNANTMGQFAGRAMAGDPQPYHHLPFFYSDLFDLGYEAVGELDARLETVEDWQEPYRQGVIYYLREGRVRGVLLWNVWSQIKAAQHLIAEPGPFTAKDLMGRLPSAR